MTPAQRRRRNRGCSRCLCSFVREWGLRPDDAVVCGHRCLVVARCGRGDRRRRGAGGHRPGGARGGRPVRGFRDLDPDLDQLGFGRRARLRAVQSGRALRRSARDRCRRSPASCRPRCWSAAWHSLSFAIAGVALVSRCFPSTFGLQSGSTLVPALKNRLSFPLGYWNGLGIEIALAYPILLAVMTSRRSRLASALAAFPLPILAAVMYLTSSRGAFAAAVVGIVAFLLLTPRRWPALAAARRSGRSGCRGRRRARAEEVPRQRRRGHCARRASGPPRGALDRNHLRSDRARVGRAGRAREADPDTVASSRTGDCRRARGHRRRCDRRGAPDLEIRRFQEQARDRQHSRHARPSAEQLRQRPMAVLGLRRIGVPRTSAERRRRGILAGLVVAARLAEGLQRVRALALPRGARRARDRRPVAHRLGRPGSGRGRDSLGPAARECGDRRRRRMRHRLFRRRCVRLGMATRGHSGRRCRDARLRTRGSSIHTGRAHGGVRVSFDRRLRCSRWRR